jgi:transposase
VVTARDRSVVAWIGVIGAVSAQDVMARFGMGRTVGYRRLRALVNHGLLSRQRLVHGQPALYAATAEGRAVPVLQGDAEHAIR